MDNTEAREHRDSRVGMGRELGTLQNINFKERERRRTSKEDSKRVIIHGEGGENQQQRQL